MQRTVNEIQLEIEKVKTAKRASERNIIRCVDRLTELDQELERVTAVKSLCDECMYLQICCPAVRGIGNYQIENGKIVFCSEILRDEMR